jgi:hypothetical protein
MNDAGPGDGHLELDSVQTLAALCASVPVVARSMSWRRRWAIAIACFSLLGQGEPSRIDPRFRSPSALLATYWEALWANDDQTLAECFADPSQATPTPGSLWFLPPSRRLSIYPIRNMSADRGRVQASYEVRFRPEDTGQDMHFLASTTLVRLHDGWRIAGEQEDGVIPPWRLVRRRVTV